MTDFSWLSPDDPMAAALAAKNWSQTSLGPVDAWPDRLKGAVDMILASPHAMIVLWGDDLSQVYNAAYCKIMGEKHPQGLGQPTRECWPEVWLFNRPIYEKVLKGQSCIYEDQDLTICRHGTPETATFDLTYSPLREADGAIAGILVTVIETTEKKRLDDELRGSREAQDLLLAELQHRVRNTLSVVRSIIRRTAVMSQDLEDMEMHLQGRIGAFARVQAAISRTGGAGGLRLVDIIDDELAVHLAREGEAVRVEGPEIRLNSKTAEIVGLAIHELSSNAVKYGALAHGGTIRVQWRRMDFNGKPWLRLEWEESGFHLDPEEAGPSGFGTELILHSLPYELDARTVMEMRPTGIYVRLEMPLEGHEAVEPIFPG